MRGLYTLTLLAGTMTLASCQMLNQLITSTPGETNVVEAPQPPARQTADNTADAPDDWPLSGHFEIVALRRAGDVAGGPEDLSAFPDMGEIAHFAEEVIWLGEACADPAFEQGDTALANYADPILSDLALAGDAPLASWTLKCAGEIRARFDQVDARVLVAVSGSGQTYSIFEQPLSAGDIEKTQAQLAMTGYLDGPPRKAWSLETLNALARFADAEGAAFAFLRPVITEALLNKLDHAASPEHIHFPDYQPKTSPDMVLDYRPRLAGEIAALPSADPENIADLTRQLETWSKRARQNPGQFTPGNMPLGANSREYEPSDAELIAFELGTRLSGALGTAHDDETTGVSGKGDGPALSYPSFTFRHVDVMGSGRFTYASAPEWAPIIRPE